MKLGINKKELAPALLMLFIGMATVLGSLNYKIGTLARMGPGYFPLILGAGLMLVACLIAITPPETDGSSRPAFVPQYRAWFLVVLGIVLFIVLGQYGGLVPATFVLGFVATLADRKNTLKTAVFVAIALTLMAIVVFYYGLQIQFPLLRWG